MKQRTTKVSNKWPLFHSRLGSVVFVHLLFHNHPDVPGAADGVVRAVVEPLPRFSPPISLPPLVRGALHEAPANVAHTIYDVGPTRVGFVSCKPGTFVVAERATAEVFFGLLTGTPTLIFPCHTRLLS